MSQQREPYFEAVTYFQAVVRQIRPDQWEQPGLGVWTIRDLVGHTSRMLANVLRDIRRPLPHPGDVDVAADYFLNALATPNQPAGVAERGRQAAAELGANPLAAISTLEDDVRALLTATRDDARVATPYGRLPLAAYLDTKIFELIVHTLDICAAASIQAAPPVGPLDDALRVALELAARRPDPAERARLLLALTGRTPLPDGFGGI